ncbi:MAG: ribosomal RNA small subunit methyltransferase A [Thaumarchaeota archaeon]|nr:ribosomal RNA small subunit methyltransferase A [Nitrososphaerota archaeon]
MNRRHRLGQHVLADSKALEEIVEAAQILPSDTVFELGVGTGNLTRLLCGKAKKVIGYEIDEQLCTEAANRLTAFKNLQLICGDGLESEKSFDVMVSNMPYSYSRKVVEWLASKRFRRAVITMQKEFAEKVMAQPGSENYGFVSVLSQARFKSSILRNISALSFNPPPKVSSTVLILEPFREPFANNVASGLKKLFSFRGRTVSSALKILEKKGETPSRYTERLDSDLLATRIEHLHPHESVTIASNILDAGL